MRLFNGVILTYFTFRQLYVDIMGLGENFNCLCD